MSKFAQRVILSIMALCLSVSLLTVSVSAASEITTTATGYTSASDVKYNISTYISNWGARGEDCKFLTTYAKNYYIGSYTYETLSSKSGGSSQSTAPSSALYSALKNMMTAKHKFINDYGDNRDLLKYTDCVSNNISKISSFYSGTMFSSVWDKGDTWNREHTWPNSKGLGGSDENDIMMIRPTITSENGARGNKAYGQGSGYYDPGVSVRGDCARIVLYVYTRWGNTSKMWGQEGVIQSLDVLLRWMQEDPVDTWEMGRNDAVQSITGVRNVFVDYPEYAFLLFGKAIPNNMTTPSGKAAGSAGNSGAGNSGTGNSGNTGSTGNSGNLGNTSNTGNSGNTGSTSSVGGSVVTPNCKHSQTKLQNVVSATCKKEGYSGDIVCDDCGLKIAAGVVTSKTDHISSDNDAVCDICGEYADNVVLSPDSDLQPDQSQTTIGTASLESNESNDIDKDVSPIPWGWILGGAVVFVGLTVIIVIVVVNKKKVK